MPGIFICYRRADAEGWAGRLSDALKAELGGVNIFRDIEDIPPGVNFDTYINDAVGSCDVLIALIGPRWLTVTDKSGRRRLDDPTDFTRLEISTALKRNVRVIPALLGGAEMPEMNSLPEDIKSLARRQAYDLSDRRWVEDCRTLANVLRPIVTPAVRSRKVKVAAIALATLVFLIVAGYGIQLWKEHQAEIARNEAAAKEKIEQERLAAQKAAEAEAQRQAVLGKQRKERETQRLAELKKQRRDPTPEVKRPQLPEKTSWVPATLMPQNGSTIRQSYAQPWRFKWSGPNDPGSVQQYHLRVIGPNAVNPLVDQKTSQTEYTFERKCSYIPDRSRLGWKWEIRSQDQDGTWTSWTGPSTFDVAPFDKEAFCRACSTAPSCQR